jgi:hypothetical protein
MGMEMGKIKRKRKKSQLQRKKAVLVMTFCMMMAIQRSMFRSDSCV